MNRRKNRDLPPSSSDVPKKGSISFITRLRRKLRSPDRGGMRVSGVASAESEARAKSEAFSEEDWSAGGSAEPKVSRAAAARGAPLRRNLLDDGGTWGNKDPAILPTFGTLHR